MLSTLTARGRNASLGILGVGYMLACLAVHADIGSSVELCPFRWLTGVDCPLCGLSHSFGCMLTGEFEAAGRYHALGPALFFLWVAATLLALGLACRDDGALLRPAP
jgi:hypothetical protein